MNWIKRKSQKIIFLPDGPKPLGFIILKLDVFMSSLFSIRTDKETSSYKVSFTTSIFRFNTKSNSVSKSFAFLLLIDFSWRTRLSVTTESDAPKEPERSWAPRALGWSSTTAAQTNSAVKCPLMPPAPAPRRPPLNLYCAGCRQAMNKTMWGQPSPLFFYRIPPSILYPT